MKIIEDQEDQRYPFVLHFREQVEINRSSPLGRFPVVRLLVHLHSTGPR